jgi:hypothetical protein
VAKQYVSVVKRTRKWRRAASESNALCVCASSRSTGVSCEVTAAQRPRPHEPPHVPVCSSSSGAAKQLNTVVVRQDSGDHSFGGSAFRNRVDSGPQPLQPSLQRGSCNVCVVHRRQASVSDYDSDEFSGFHLDAIPEESVSLTEYDDVVKSAAFNDHYLLMSCGEGRGSTLELELLPKRPRTATKHSRKRSPGKSECCCAVM